MSQAVHIECLFDLNSSSAVFQSLGYTMTVPGKSVGLSHRNEAKAFDGFIKIGNMEKDKIYFQIRA